MTKVPEKVSILGTMAQTGLLVSIAGVLVNVRGCLAEGRGYELGWQWGWILGVAGIAVSLVTVTACLVAGRRRAGETLVRRSPSLLLPYLLIQPYCYFNAVGFGLGGDFRSRETYTQLSLGALLLGAATFAVILWSHLRSRA